jgi:hypothetical protein
VDELLGSLGREAEALAAAVRQGCPVLDAYLYQSSMRCGKAACRCMASDYRHRQWCLSYCTADGKSHTRTVPDEAVIEVREMCEQYRRLRAFRKRLLGLAEEVTAALDRHVQRQAAKGWQRFEQAKTGPRKTATPRGGRKRTEAP